MPLPRKNDPKKGHFYGILALLGFLRGQGFEGLEESPTGEGRGLASVKMGTLSSLKKGGGWNFYGGGSSPGSSKKGKNGDFADFGGPWPDYV